MILVTLLLWTPLSVYLWTRWSGECATCFLIAETIVLLVGCINTHVLMEGTLRRQRQGGPLVTWNDLQEAGVVPHVLLVIPTYHEGVAILEKTLTAVARLEYPTTHLTVVIGDDGNDNEVRDFIHTRFPPFFYHRRLLLKGHAKAGNINDILFASEDVTPQYQDHLMYPGEFVLVLDCDMIPRPDILLNLLPLFFHDGVLRNPKCAFVQSPQAFHNILGFDWLGQHYQFFYHVVQKAYSGFSLGVPCCGTNVLFDRRLLMEIGGFQYGSVTEDFNTSLLIHSRGLVSKYYTGLTAEGMSPLSLVEFYHQRKRWSVGGLQIVFSPTYFAKVRRLPLVYQWVYTFSGASPLLALFLGVLMVGPLTDLLGHHVFLCHLVNHRYLITFLPYATVYVACLGYLHRSLSWRVMLTSFQETIFMVFFSLRFLASFLRKKLGFQNITFKTTRKSKDGEKDQHISTFFLLLPFLLFYALSGTAMTLRLVRDGVDGALYVDAFWLVLIMFQLLPVLAYVVQERSLA